MTDRRTFVTEVTRLWEQRLYEDAIDLSRQRLAAQPEDAAAYQALCHSLASVGRVDEAIDTGRRGLDLEPDSTGAHHVYAEALVLGSRLDDALEVYDACLQRHPDDAATIGHKAFLLVLMRRYEACESLLAPHLDSAVPDPRIVVAFAELAPRIDAVEKAISLLARLVEDEGAPSIYRRQAGFRLGAMLDKAGRYDEAFEVYTAANHRVAPAYSADERCAMIDEVIGGWTRRTMRKAVRFGDDSEAPILLIKMPRSGSTLIEQILGCHPAIGTAGESGAFGHAAHRLGLEGSRARIQSRLRSLSRQDVQRTAREALSQMRARAGSASRITDASLNNDRHAGLFATLFPRGRIIVCLRHAWDTCLSCYFQDFASNLPWSYRLRDIARYRHDHESLLRHWNTTLDVPIHFVQYEELVTSPDSVVRGMLDFLGLPWHAGCLEFHASGRAAVTASHQQVSQPLYTESRHRYLRYETHIDELKRLLPEPCFKV